MLTIRSELNQDVFYATSCSAGFDLRAAEACTIPAGEYRAVSTGLYIEDHAASVDVSYGSRTQTAVPELQIRPRSGLAARFGVTVLNSPGTIDADYRGEIKVILVNHSQQTFHIAVGDRIAQAVCSLALHLPSVPNRDAERGKGGFGSTGHQ
jgi:dUTP pyrophosphatase